MSQGKKRLNLEGADVIGFDETNHVFNINRQLGIPVPLLVTGYLIKGYSNTPAASVVRRNENGEYPGFGKNGVFKKEGALPPEEIQKRAKKTIQLLPDFLYTRITPGETRRDPLPYLMAKAVACITLKFFQDQDLKEDHTLICLDDIGGEERDSINYYLFELLKDSQLFFNDYSRHIYFQKDADTNNKACLFADRVGFHLLALRSVTLRSSNPRARWPYKNKAVDHRKFEDYKHTYHQTLEDEITSPPQKFLERI